MTREDFLDMPGQGNAHLNRRGVATYPPRASQVQNKVNDIIKMLGATNGKTISGSEDLSTGIRTDQYDTNLGVRLHDEIIPSRLRSGGLRRLLVEPLT